MSQSQRTDDTSMNNASASIEPIRLATLGTLEWLRPFDDCADEDNFDAFTRDTKTVQAPSK